MRSVTMWTLHSYTSKDKWKQDSSENTSLGPSVIHVTLAWYHRKGLLDCKASMAVFFYRMPESRPLTTGNSSGLYGNIKSVLHMLRNGGRGGSRDQHVRGCVDPRVLTSL
ncbi:hypothetical protein TNCV_785261 [Trichonephila clavipes]|nr:hypothetical protein TNCV_785261 [Trichonephila clavipes]